MVSSTAPNSIFFFAETAVAIVFFSFLMAYYTHVLLLLAVEYDRFKYSGSDADYTFNPNRRIKAGIILFLLAIIEMLQASLAFFYPALKVAGQMKLLALAIFNLFAFIIATMIFGGILLIREYKQADRSADNEAEPDFELAEIVVSTEEAPAEDDSDDSLDLD